MKFARVGRPSSAQERTRRRERCEGILADLAGLLHENDEQWVGGLLGTRFGWQAHERIAEAAERLGSGVR